MDVLHLTRGHGKPLNFTLPGKYRICQNLDEKEGPELPHADWDRSSYGESEGAPGTELQPGSPCLWDSHCPPDCFSWGTFWVILLHAQRRCGPAWLISQLEKKLVLSTTSLQHIAQFGGHLSPLLLPLDTERKTEEKTKILTFCKHVWFFSPSKRFMRLNFYISIKYLDILKRETDPWMFLIWPKMELFKIKPQ